MFIEVNKKSATKLQILTKLTYTSWSISIKLSINNQWKRKYRNWNIKKSKSIHWLFTNNW